jgi:hypothetical protein
MKTQTIEIVDRGRGPQLSTRKITVQDLLPFYRENVSNDEIRRWLPMLSDEEIGVLKDYIRCNFDEVVKAEQRIKAFHGTQRAAQPAWTRANDHLTPGERIALLREKAANRKSEKNGADDSRG